ncbi:GPW/gp25 family protein [Duganella sp. sic0402]|uniref:GPW/gp25 family protein n=1 Tax=Duganella sp. sic0402 TaxID=2854786 RepID=UPI001C4950EC|nr:GPW/gp25 family protein [Duganella sp. sic0402]MBV7534712.1 GPW/gp25 family protein [Duganella sp. sic0402]
MRGRDPSFLGAGWSFPPTFSRSAASVVISAGDANIQQSLWVLLSTNIGERLMLEAYGSDLHQRVFDSLDTTMASEIKSTLSLAILNWEPRVEVLRIELSQVDPLRGQLAITIDYVVRQTNSRSNLVYPFYLNEATISPA